MAQWDWKLLCSARMQVQSLARPGGLKDPALPQLQCRSNCGSDLIPGLGTPYLQDGQKKKRKKKKIQSNISVKQKQTHKCREQTCGCQVGKQWGGKDWEFRTNRGKLVCIRCINNNNVLLYSTGNYIQYPEINCNGKEQESVVSVCV